jgi:hypothetical protein
MPGDWCSALSNSGHGHGHEYIYVSYSGRPKYNPFFKKDRIFAAAYFRTQAW